MERLEFTDAYDAVGAIGKVGARLIAIAPLDKKIQNQDGTARNQTPETVWSDRAHDIGRFRSIQVVRNPLIKWDGKLGKISVGDPPASSTLKDRHGSEEVVENGAIGFLRLLPNQFVLGPKVANRIAVCIE